MIRLILAALFLVASCSFVATARASCPTMTITHGITGSLYRISDSAKGLQLSKVNFSVGYSAQENFLPNSDCTVHWLSLVEGGLTGLGQSTIAPGAAYNLTPVAGIGVHNSIVRILVGYDALNIGAESSGLLIGRVAPGDFSIFLSLGLNFDLFSLATAATTDTVRLVEPVTPEPPGFVKP